MTVNTCLQGKFVSINEAYTVLSNKEQRSKFDSKQWKPYASSQGTYSSHHSANQDPHQHWAYRESAHQGWWERSDFDGAWYAANNAQRSSRANRAGWSSRPSHTNRELVHKAVTREVSPVCSRKFLLQNARGPPPLPALPPRSSPALASARAIPTRH